MEYDGQMNEGNQNPLDLNSNASRSLATRWARLIRSNELDRLVIDGIPAWSALTAVAAVMESPRMEVLLGLDAGLQVMNGSDDIDPVNLPLRYAVCVDGPIEQADADAIERAVVSSSSLMDADIRAAASVLNRSGLVEVQGRSNRPLLAVIAEMLRNFLAEALQCPAADIPLPESDIIDSIMSWTGRLAMRPVETDIYPDFVDLGIVLPETDEIGPASSSIIYDRRTQTWHAD
ncbi:MAG: hypothetical protein CMJ29_06145 [Phycisphaerae bacterium]|nr:hypothetical protein [Phycisphaerae bacterium]